MSGGGYAVLRKQKENTIVVCTVMEVLCVRFPVDEFSRLVDFSE